MVFLDINTFFSPKAGGIRAYHQAKLDWFRKQSRHRYVLVYPGPRFRVREEGPQTTLVEVYGPAMTADAQGYRLLLDYPRVYGLIRRLRPDVLEAGDPWLTGLFCLLIRKLGLYRGLLASFYHSDPARTYLQPWAARGKGSARRVKKILVALAARCFYWAQRKYPLTATASLAMSDHLRSEGITRIAHLPFGIPSPYLERPRASGTEPKNGIRFLYAGRLDREKGVEMILDFLPRILALDKVGVTVAGRGAFADRFEMFRHPRFRFLSFLEGPDAMRDLYDAHHVLLAPSPYETFGLAVLEAMARGLAVVGPDQGGTGELLRQAGSPFLFKAGDGEDFYRKAGAAAVCDWEKESARSRETALAYGSWDDAVARMIAHYQNAAGG